MNKFFLLILFCSYTIYATSFATLDKKKFVEDTTSKNVSVRTSSDYFSILPLIQQTGILNDITFDNITYENISENSHLISYYGTTGTDLQATVVVNYVSPSSWYMQYWASEKLLLESGDNVLLESGYKIVLEHDNI